MTSALDVYDVLNTRTSEKKGATPTIDATAGTVIRVDCAAERRGRGQDEKGEERASRSQARRPFTLASAPFGDDSWKVIGPAAP